MNDSASGLSVFRNKNQAAFEGRHNPAQRVFVDRQTLLQALLLEPFFRGPDHHDKTSSRAACHHSAYSDAIRKRSIARPNRSAGDGAGSRTRQGRQATPEGSATRTPGTARRTARCSAAPCTTSSACCSATPAACCAAAAASCRASRSSTAASCAAGSSRRRGATRRAEGSGCAERGACRAAATAAPEERTSEE
jgi:hypothetical protein